MRDSEDKLLRRRSSIMSSVLGNSPKRYNSSVKDEDASPFTRGSAKSIKSSRMRSTRRPSTAATRQQFGVITPKTAKRNDLPASSHRDVDAQKLINEYAEVIKSKVLTPRKTASPTAAHTEKKSN